MDKNCKVYKQGKCLSNNETDCINCNQDTNSKIFNLGGCSLTVVLILIFILIFVQLGIKHGRELATSELSYKLLSINQELTELEEKNNDLEQELDHWKLVDQVIEGESSNQHQVWGDGGKSFGIAQFQKKTFNYLAQKAEFKNANWKNKNDQIALLSWSIKNGYGKNWTVYRRIINARTETIRSKKNI